MRAVLPVAVVVGLVLGARARPARADDLCGPGPRRGAPIELDVKDAELQDVFRLIADVGKINLVVSDEVQGKLTMKLARVPWQTAACAIAKAHHLALSFDQGILLVTKR